MQLQLVLIVGKATGFWGEVLWWVTWEEGKWMGESASFCSQECSGGITYNVL